MNGVMKKITDIFAKKEKTFSFEFFPPKTDKGRDKLAETAAFFAQQGADFFSVTYGAGGSESKATLDVVLNLLYHHDVPVMHHLTCVKHTFDDIRKQLAGMQRVGVQNIMALRGDPPANDPGYKPGPDHPRFGYELIKLIREHGDWFSIGVPGFPEGHPLTPTLDLDSKYLKVKQDCGADFVVTQVFFDNHLYYDYLKRTAREGVAMRVIPGILPITDYAKLVQFCQTCGATIPQWIHDTFAPLKDDPEATLQKGIDVVTRQCQDLLDHGAPGLHFYCLNKIEPTTAIFMALKR